MINDFLKERIPAVFVFLVIVTISIMLPKQLFVASMIFLSSCIFKINKLNLAHHFEISIAILCRIFLMINLEKRVPKIRKCFLFHANARWDNLPSLLLSICITIPFPAFQNIFNPPWSDPSDFPLVDEHLLQLLRPCTM